MYNLYTYEKNQSLKAKNKIDEEKSKKIRIKRKFQLSKLTSNYDKRMNDFIINLCYHPIFIKDYTTEKNNLNLKLSSKTPQSKFKSFSFGGFMTDKNRISLINKEKELNKKYEEKIMKEKSRNLKSKSRSEEKHKLIQPRMRFKPRNELERIIEVMDLLGKNKSEKKVKKMLDQLKQTDIDRLKQAQGYGKLKQLYKHKALDKKNQNNNNNSKNKSENNSSDDENPDLDLDFTLEVNLHRKLRNINLQLKKQKQLRNKRLTDNNGETLEEKQLLSKIRSKNKELLELFKDDVKMYFKGASQYVMKFHKNKKKVRINSAYPFYNSTNNIENNNIENDIKKLRLKNIQKINYKRSDENKRPMSVNDVEDNKERLRKYFKDDSIKKLGIRYQIKKRNMDELIKKEIDKSLLTQFFSKLNKKEYNQYFSEPFFLEKNKIMLHNEVKTIDNDLDNKLNYLRKIIDINNEKYRRLMKPKPGIFNKKIFKRENDDNDINIDGKKFKQDDIKNIADAIFTKCGYYNKKIE